MAAYRTRVAGHGAYLPPKVLTNHDLEKMIETSDEWITSRTGIKHRHIAEDGIVTSDLAHEASLRALKSAGVKATDLDLIIVATITPDQLMPTTACMLQSKLGCTGVPAFDLGAACSGFLYALTTADQFIRSGMYKRILVVGVELLHTYLDYKDRDTCILFGDGAGAWVVERADEGADNVIMSSHLRAEGSLWELLHLPAGGTKHPMSYDVIDKNLHRVKMNGREIFKNAVRTMSHTCQLALETNQIPMEKIDWLIPHQANWRIMEAVADHFKFPKDKVINVVHETANISAATIPVAFNMAIDEGKVKRGDLILLTAFGAGLTAGSVLMRY